MSAVVVGVDGSEEGLGAARWAAAEAAWRGVGLRIVTAVSRWEVPGADSGPARGGAVPRPQQNLRAAAQAAKEISPKIDVHDEVLGEDPARALLHAAEGAPVLAIGSRALGPVAGFVLGSVGLSVIAHATMPVVAVRQQVARRPGTAPIVVGLDLRHSYGPLLDFAFETADRRGAALRVAHAWSAQGLYAYPSALPDPTVLERVGDSAEAELSQALSPWRRRFPRLGVDTELAMGASAPFLVESSTDASLLVVGRRLRGHPFPTRIGPVTHAALHHAACPVAVVPHE
ncbi:universal stress protein [Streptomyces sp. B15]|uniref:universal stress protein n=1 Tax=Streptomyces sp. B15 TaxID=1537797 RepID=UPI00161D3129|nr:universal stress protein [Streptomyces sp. B15]MBQ1120639.1 universal stress protein [Streptomyces sp. B15]